ncbi:MAG: sugar phosphate isomerase/epimerase [Spirochaetia bacterium]|nr:sugar phosphate isomerase/epimerase [Spirochaetia bacterium]
MKQVKSAVITGFIGKTQDRFRAYNSDRTLEEKFALLSEIDEIDGVEIVYPYEVPEASVCRELLDRYHLQPACVNVNIKNEPEFINGGITSEDPAIRAKAVSMIKEAKDYAAAVGADRVQCCPLGDGYEFSFQCEYGRMWDYLVEGFAEAAAYRPEITLYIEYKPNEVRGKCFIDSAAKALYLLQCIGSDHVGVTLDFGHSMYGGETPAEAVSLLEHSPYPYYIHINDNDATWDWDYMVGTKHFLEYVEFLYYLKKFGYSGYFTSDTSPTRLDIKETFRANARWTNRIWDLLDRMDLKRLEELMKQDEYTDTWKYLERELFFRGDSHA